MKNKYQNIGVSGVISVIKKTCEYRWCKRNLTKNNHQEKNISLQNTGVIGVLGVYGVINSYF